MKVLFIVPYPREGPSNRFRIEQYLPCLREKGINYSLRPFYNRHFYLILYKVGYYCQKFLFLFFFIMRRLSDAFAAKSYDVVFIHREAGPFPDYILEWLFRVFGRKIIYDFDDSVFLKKPSKIRKVISMSDTVIAGNDFLKNYAARYNPRVSVLPTCIDTTVYQPRTDPKKDSKITIGWIGTSFTSIYLDLLRDAYRALAEKYRNIEFKIVGAILADNALPLVCKPWSLDSEVRELQDFDIGVMPLFDDEWAKGKCAFKIIQYMAVGIPSVASRVGMNIEVIEDGKDGFLVTGTQEWIDKLSLLIENKELRHTMGQRARQKVENVYSVQANQQKFIDIIENA